MARSEARVSVDIWTDADFVALSCSAQRLYFFLLSQQDLAHDGVIALRVRRWAGSAGGLNEQDVRRDLDMLAAARFVVVDEDTEELLIRSLIRRDGIYRQPNLMRAAQKHLSVVTSAPIRAALAEELRRIRSLSDIHERCVELVGAMLTELYAEPPGNPSTNPPANPSESPSRHTLGERGMVTAVTKGFPSPLDPFPTPSASPPATAQRSRADAEFVRFWEIYPRRQAKAAARKAFDKAIRTVDPARILTAAMRYRDDPGRDPQFTAHAATWLNQGRWDDEPLPRGSPNGSTTDRRVADALALAAEFRVKEVDQ